MQHKNSTRLARFEIGSVVVLLSVVMASVLMLPATALGQATPSLTPVPSAVATTGTPATTPQTTTTPVAAPALALSTSSGLANGTITANGSGFRPGEIVDVSFNGPSVGSPTVNTGGTFSLSFSVPNLPPGQYGVLAKGQSSGFTASTAFTVNQGAAAVSFSAPQGAPGDSLTVTNTGFQPGETVELTFNGAPVGTAIADVKGTAMVTFTLPSLPAGTYVATATGVTSAFSADGSLTLVAAAAAAATAAPTATPAAAPAPAPAPAAPNAPAIVHDDRYFSQTGYRIDSDDVWNFFQQYGGPSTFGYPVSRNMSFLGCPVQMFQRHIIQVCAGQGAALINLLDPEIFPYTKVNGSIFPAPDNTLKANTPAVGSPTYATDISTFIQTNVPDTFNGQPVNFQQTFNTLGGLTIWGAPISSPQPDPSNGNFIYQRFQRGIMHYIAGSGTQSVLLADYLKAIIMNQNVPTDLMAQAQETRFFGQYCPGQTGWLCRPADLPGTDLTFAFVNG